MTYRNMTIMTNYYLIKRYANKEFNFYILNANNNFSNISLSKLIKIGL